MGTPASIRHAEYFKSKIETMLEMVHRAKRGGEDFDCLLVDSWFMCSEVVKTVTGLGRHVFWMLKSNINSFSVDGEMLKTGQADLVKSRSMSEYSLSSRISWKNSPSLSASQTRQLYKNSSLTMN